MNDECPCLLDTLLLLLLGFISGAVVVGTFVYLLLSV